MWPQLDGKPSIICNRKCKKDAVATSANLCSSSKLRSSSCLKSVFCCSYMREACSARCLSFNSFISIVVSRWATEINSLSSRSCDLAVPVPATTWQFSSCNLFTSDYIQYATAVSQQTQRTQRNTAPPNHINSKVFFQETWNSCCFLMAQHFMCN